VVVALQVVADDAATGRQREAAVRAPVGEACDPAGLGPVEHHTIPAHLPGERIAPDLVGGGDDVPAVGGQAHGAPLTLFAISQYEQMSTM
jgi:hypothetical protein